ncbi:MAG TPA: M20/M25/M40 family metallo-hydrolase [Thermoleophilaceae bacterium]
MSTAAVPRASREEKDRLVADFIRLCEIESPSRKERPAVDAMADELRRLGLEVQEDSSGSETGSDSGNLIARIPGPDGARTILLCAHLDTVPLVAPVEVARENGLLTNSHEAILGADNKAAVATILGVARRLVREGSPVGVELVFTTCEEIGLRGAKALDRSQLRSEYGFVFDHASPIGELIVAAPTYYRIDARFRGHAAHAGIRPEAGRNAISAAAGAISRIDFGRLDADTTANVGTISGGTAPNVVAEHCFVELEARSLDDSRAASVVSQMVDAITEAASDAECDVETAVEEQNRGYRMARTSPPVVAAAAALEALGFEPTYLPTGGCSDANIFVASGIPCLNVANGTERNHQPDESVTVEALETMLDVTLGIVAQSA